MIHCNPLSINPKKNRNQECSIKLIFFHIRTDHFDTFNNNKKYS